MVSSIRFKPRHFVAFFGVMLLLVGAFLTVSAPAAKAAGSAGDGFLVSTAPGATPGTSTVTITRTLNIPDVPIAPASPQLTLVLGGGATFISDDGATATVPLAGPANTTAPALTIRCAASGTTLTVVGWYDVPVLCSGALPPPIPDVDQDTVPDDGTDKCLGTPAGTVVDATGCAVVVAPTTCDPGLGWKDANNNGKVDEGECHKRTGPIAGPPAVVPPVEAPPAAVPPAAPVVVAPPAAPVVTVPPAVVPATIDPVESAPVVTKVEETTQRAGTVVPARTDVSSTPVTFGPDISQQSLGGPVPGGNGEQPLLFIGAGLLAAFLILEIKARRRSKAATPSN